MIGCYVLQRNAITWFVQYILLSLWVTVRDVSLDGPWSYVIWQSSRLLRVIRCPAISQYGVQWHGRGISSRLQQMIYPKVTVVVQIWAELRYDGHSLGFTYAHCWVLIRFEGFDCSSWITRWIVRTSIQMLKTIPIINCTDFEYVHRPVHVPTWMT